MSLFDTPPRLTLGAIMSQRAHPSARASLATRRAKSGAGNGQEDWRILSGNVSVISREFHNLMPMEGGEVSEFQIISGNIPVVSLELWKLRAMKKGEPLVFWACGAVVVQG